jgi:uncharacterized protein
MQSGRVVVMWRRIDQPGHEVMRFTSKTTGARIEGFAAYREADGPIGLRYRVEVGPDWTTRRATIAGQARGNAFRHQIERVAQGWRLDGVSQEDLDDIPHLDLGFTPATNMPQLRHAALAEGEAATFDVAWFDVGRRSLERLSQGYRRVDQRRFAYESPATGYAAELELGEDGFTSTYPGLWERVPG